MADTRPIRFGTDGWRGVIADDFTVARVRVVAQAIVAALASDGVSAPRLVIGHDCRFGAAMFAEAAAEEIAGAGGTALLAEDYAPTPALSWATVAEKADGAIVITASHNPPHYNGLKFKAAHGGSASPALTARFEAEIASGAGVDGSGGSIRPLADLRERYLGRMRELSAFDNDAMAGTSIVVDPLFGSGRGWLSELLSSFGATVTEIHGDADPAFGGLLPEPIPPHTDALAGAVIDAGADFGIALDGDADRLGAVTSSGRFVNSHEIFALLLAHLVERRGLAGRVVKTISTSDRIARMADHYGLALVETPVGFKYICEEMRAGDVLIGGEESGGIGIAGHVPERDGLLCALLLAEAGVESEKSLDDLLGGLDDRFGPSAYDRMDVHLAHEAKEILLARLAEYRPEAIALGAGKLTPVMDILDVDGWKYRIADGWVMIRPSGTEDLVRLYAEGNDETAPRGMLDWAERAVDRLSADPESEQP